MRLNAKNVSGKARGSVVMYRGEASGAIVCALLDTTFSARVFMADSGWAE